MISVRTPDEVRLSDVEVIVLMQPSRMRQAARYVEGAKLGLKYFGLWYGRYPYRTLTVVDPAHGGGGAGGMEYPTLITAGTAWPLGYWPLSGLRGAEMVTVHEFGHQFWYGLVGNNEFEEAWLDEGFNSYSTGKVMELGYGHDTALLRMPGLRVGQIESVRLQNGPDYKYDRVRQFTQLPNILKNVSQPRRTKLRPYSTAGTSHFRRATPTRSSSITRPGPS